MMTSPTSLSQPTLEEQAATLSALLPVYSTLVREFVIEVPVCPVDPNDRELLSSGESIEQLQAWFQQVDAEIQVHQLRQFLQTTPLASEDVLRQLLLHHIHKGARSNSDRDKADFLLVQYFSLCAPSGLDDAQVDLNYVFGVLAPVLGTLEGEAKLPDWLSPIETLMQSAARSQRLSELLHSGILEQGRKLKTQNASRYFEPAAMVAFTRFGFIVRRIFFRLMHDDLNAIQDGLRELHRRGIATIDCRRAQFSANEPIARLRMICQSWRIMFHAEYSSGQPLRMLVDLRAAVDDALQNEASRNQQARSAAAGSQGGGSEE